MQSPRSLAFVHEYKSVYGAQEISACAPLGYDAVWLFADAIVRLNSLVSETIREALAGTQE